MGSQQTQKMFRATRVWPSSAVGLIEDGVVAVEGDRIAFAGAWSDVKDQYPAGSVRDLGDVTIMPGLFDCHVHLQHDPSGATTTLFDRRTDREFTDLIIKHASLLLDAGVTTTRDLGSRGTTVFTTRDRINRGEVPGPRIHVAGAPLTVPGGHAHKMGGECSGVDGVRAAVKMRADQGADLIKVMATGGFMTAGTRPSEARFTQEEMNAVKAEAEVHNITVTTHATGTEGIAQAVEARFDCIEHCAWINHDGEARFDPVVAQKLVDRDIAVCPTMNTACTSHTYFCPWDAREAIIENLRKMRAAGVKLIAGTDSGIGLCRFERYADGLEALADAGYTPAEVAVMATESAAEACRLSEETGRLIPGLSADIAAFEGNPLEDINAYARPAFVMARGQEHKLTAIAPLGDIKKKADETFKILREGSGLKKIAGMS